MNYSDVFFLLVNTICRRTERVFVRTRQGSSSVCVSVCSRIKEAAYSIYTDIKNRTQFLLSENLKKIRDVDIDMDLQSICCLLPDKGSSDK